MKYINTISPKKGDQKLRHVYAEIKQTFPGPVADPYKMHSLDSEILSIYWDINKFVYFSGKFNRQLKDVIAAGVSKANQCPFCFESHTELLRFKDEKLKQAFIENNTDLIEDTFIRELSNYSLNIFDPNNATIKNPPFADNDRAEVIGTALMFTYTNILANVFLNESVIPVSDKLGIKSLLWKLASPVLKKASRLELDISHDVVFDGLPPTLKWAQNDELIGKAFHALYYCLEKRSSFIDIQLKNEAIERINSWNGESLGLNGNVTINKWLEKEEYVDKDLLRLMYKSMYCSYTVTPDDMEPLLSKYSQRELLITVAWSAAQVCKRISKWL